jgi:hypothetical protein
MTTPNSDQPAPETLCENCSKGVPHSEISACSECGLDGLCPDCIAPDQHKCEEFDR